MTQPLPASTSAHLDILRYRRVVRFFGRLFLSFIWWDVVLRRVPGLRGLAQRTALDRWRGLARRYRRLAVEMGGVLIKLGQFLSIRVDVLPEAVTSELTGLQDEVPGERLEDVLGVVQGEFGRPADAVFAWFSPQPEAAASLAQVHRARLATGDEVVVKVQRPRIGLIVDTDLAAIRVAVRWLKLYPPVARRVNLDLLFNEFATVTRSELDFVAEGHNAEHFAQDFADDPGIVIAQVYWQYTTARVLTLENVASIKITDFEALEAAGISRAQVARRLYDTYLKQIFVTNFVHADPHPGNLFVRPVAAAAGREPGGVAVAPGTGGAEGGAEAAPGAARGTPFQLIFVDFGMVATIPEKLRGSLREYIIAIGLRDAHRLVQAYVDAGVLLPGADLKRLELLHDEMFRRLAGVRMGQLANIAMEQAEFVFHEYRDIMQEMPFQFPVDILFVGRAVGILSGIATSLDPDFDPWAATIPFAERLATGEVGRGLRAGLEQLGELARVAFGLPGRVDHFLRQVERGDIAVQMGLAPDSARQLRRIERSIDRLSWAVIFLALLGGGVALMAAHTPGWLGSGLLAAAALAFLWGITRH